MARGQRFELNLDPDSDSDLDSNPPRNHRAAPLNLVKDIQEHSLPDSGTSPAVPPAPKASSSSGFPAPRIFKSTSRFKQQRQQQQGVQRSDKPPPDNDLSRRSGNTSTPQKGQNYASSDERVDIDRENKQVLARMSEAEIEQERRELLQGGIPGLTPSLIERLLKRGNVSEGSNEEKGGFGSLESRDGQAGLVDKKNTGSEDSAGADATAASTLQSTTQPRSPAKEGVEDTAESDTEELPRHQSSNSIVNGNKQIKPAPSPPAAARTLQGQAHYPEAAPRLPPSDLQPASSKTAPTQPSFSQLSALHSMQVSSPSLPTPTPSLDPNSPSFLTDLHNTYYPDLPANPSSLSWLQQGSDKPSSYDPSQEAVSPSALRFDFRGQLLPPTLSSTLPVSLGLHHHADAPDSAGYTIGELALLQRSTVVAQRCVAIQTLGRILFRLGRGELGEQGSEIVEGLWTVVGREGVVARLIAEAGSGIRADITRDSDDAEVHGTDTGPRSGSTRTAWALATEAVWLWQRGGGRGGTEYQTR